MQVKLNVPATDTAAPTTETFVAVGLGILAGVPSRTKRRRSLLRMQVKLNVPATDTAAPTTETFVAVGLGILVTEDWSSQGSIHLFRLVRERTQGFDGQLSERWTLVDTYRREFSGPVTALATAGGNLAAAWGHNVRALPLLAMLCVCLLYTSPSPRD